MFDDLLKVRFDTMRLTVIEETNKEELTALLINQKGMWQPMSDEEMLGNEKLSQMYKLFCKRIDIKSGDRVIMEGNEFTVKSIDDFDFGTFPHLECLLVKMK